MWHKKCCCHALDKFKLKMTLAPLILGLWSSNFGKRIFFKDLKVILVSFFEIFASNRFVKISKSPLSRCRACPWFSIHKYLRQIVELCSITACQSGIKQKNVYLFKLKNDSICMHEISWADLKCLERKWALSLYLDSL